MTQSRKRAILSRGLTEAPEPYQEELPQANLEEAIEDLFAIIAHLSSRLEAVENILGASLLPVQRNKDNILTGVYQEGNVTHG